MFPIYSIIHFHRNMIVFTNIQVRRLLVETLKLKTSSKVTLQNRRVWGSQGGAPPSQEALVCMFLEAASIALTLAMRS